MDIIKELKNRGIFTHIENDKNDLRFTIDDTSVTYSIDDINKIFLDSLENIIRLQIKHKPGQQN